MPEQNDHTIEYKQSPEGQEFLSKEDERQKAYAEEQERYEASLKEQEKVEAAAEYAEEQNAADNNDLRPDSDGDSAPAQSASKGDWVDYAVANGASREEAEGQTKDDLIAAYGG